MGILVIENNGYWLAGILVSGDTGYWLVGILAREVKHVGRLKRLT